MSRVCIYKETIGDLPLQFNEKMLTNLIPGITDHGRDKNGNGYIEPDEVRKFEGRNNAARLTIRDESKRPLLENIAEAVKTLKGFYILNAYQNIERFEPKSTIYFDNRGISTNGSMCSGTIWWADKLARIGYDDKEMNVGTYDAETISNNAYQLFTILKTAFHDSIEEVINNKFKEEKPHYQSTLDADDANLAENYTESFFKLALHTMYDVGLYFLSDYIWNDLKRQVKNYLFSEYDAPTKLANQIINTFLFNRYDDLTDYWREHLDETLGSATVSPDNLLMVGMPSPNNTFNGVQTANSSFYDAIEDYKNNGGYYYKFTEPGDVTAPVDTRTGEPPSICVYENTETAHVLPNGVELNAEFEIIPIPEELGGKHSKTMSYSIKNDGFATPLELIGTPPVNLSGASQFNIAHQPNYTMIDGGARTKFGIEFAFDPAQPGTYSTVISIPNSDENNAAYSCTLKIKGINESYFIDNPIYYNQCENEDDLFNPLIGAQFGSKAVESHSGDYAGFAYIPGKFNNGYRVINRNRKGGRYGQALVYPFGDTFDEDKPDLSRGTCAFWADANGEWRHKDDDTAVDSMMLFSLVDAVTTDKINESAQVFLLKSWTRNGGDYRVDDSHASIDNIIFWNKIVDAESIAAIYKPKDTLL